MARAGSVTVDIIANAAQFVREMAKIRRNTETTSRQLRTFGRTATAAFAFLGGRAFVRDILETGNALQDFSDRIGVNAQQLQAWQLIAEQSGVSTNALNLAVQRLSRRSAEAAQGTGEAVAALKELRIDAQEFNRLDLDERLFTLARAFDGTANQADRLRLAFKLFDSEGTSVLQFFDEGEEGLRKFREQLQGQLWSNEQISQIAKLNTELTKLGQQFTLTFGPIIAGIGAAFTGAISAAQTQARRLVNFYQALGGNVNAAATLAQLNNEVPTTTSGSTPPSAGRPRTRYGPQWSKLFPNSGGFQSAADVRAAAALDALAATPAGNGAGLTERLDVQFAESITKYEQGLQRAARAQDQFTDLFTDNLVQAADGSFNAILDSWRRTLVQMAAATVASRFWKLISGTQFGGALTGFLGGGGDAAAAADTAKRGPG